MTTTVQKILLKDLGTIQSGYTFRGRVPEDPAGPLSVVQLRDVDWLHNRIVWEQVTPIVDVQPKENHFLQSEDVLFAAKGSYNRAVWIEEAPPDTLAASTFFLLRLTSLRILPAYLAWYLNQSPAQAHLGGCARGSTIPVITASCLGSLPIPVPAVEVQKRIVKIADLARLEQELLAALAERREMLVQNACLNLIQ